MKFKLVDWAPIVPDSWQYEYDLCEAWRKWQAASCEEWNSGHCWYVEIINNDEENSTDVHCEHCPVSVSDVFVDDYVDLLNGTLGDIEIQDGLTNILGEFKIPVNVAFHVESYTSMDSIGPEYDLWIELTLRGHPQRIEDAPISVQFSV